MSLVRREFIMHFIGSILWFLVYLLNHEEKSIERLPLLAALTLAISLIFTFFSKIFNLFHAYTVEDFCAYFALACIIDNFIFIYQNKNKEKENKVK